MKLRFALSFCAFLVVLLLPCFQYRVYAAPPDVTNTNDSGAGSLRQAMSLAVSGDTINIKVAGTINLSSSLTVTNKTLTIVKHNTVNGDVIISSNGFRVFVVSTTGNLTLNSVTVTNGPAKGGGIENAGTLTLNRVSIEYTLSRQKGGALLNTGTATIRQSAIYVNTAIDNGGGIYNSGTLVVANTTIAGNWTPSQGGGIYNTPVEISPGVASPASLTVINSTIADNRANQFGGGIFNARITLSNGTVVQRVATVKNTIIANSRDSLNCENISAVNSLQFPGKSCGADANSAPPQLGTGITSLDFAPVITLLPGSPAIDTGGIDGCKSPDVNQNDQRGFKRTVDGNGDGVIQCDIGAFEAPGAPTTSAHFVPSSIVPSGTINGPYTRLEFDIYNPTPGLTLTNLTFNNALPASFKVAHYQPEKHFSDKCLNATNADFAFSTHPTTHITTVRVVPSSGISIEGNTTCTVSVNVVGSEVGRYNYTASPSSFDQPIPSVSGEATVVRVGVYSCNKSGLQLAITNGGPATFECNQPTVVEADAGRPFLLSNSLIDGQGGATLKAPGRGTVFFRAEGPQTIQGLTVSGSEPVVIQSGSNLYIQNSTFSGSRSLLDGGLFVVKSGGQLGIFNSTFYDNQSDRHGGVIYVESGGFAVIYSSTFTQNSANLGGGAIYVEDGGRVYIFQSTFSQNSRESPALVWAGTSTSQLYMSGNIIFDTCEGPIAITGYNLQYPGPTCGSGVGMVTGNPLLQSVLTDNGGSTRTLAIASNSPANNASPICGSRLDQRGFVRPSSLCDLGAFELGGVQPDYRLSILDNPQNVISGSSFNLKLEAIDSTGAPIQAYTGTARLSSSVLGVTTLSNVSFTGNDDGVRTLKTTLLPPGIHKLTATDVSEPAITGSVTLEVRAQPRVTMNFNPTFVSGGITKLTYTINNPNPHMSLHGVSISQVLPVSYLYVPGLPETHNTCGGQVNFPPLFFGTVIDIQGITLTPNQTCQIEFNVFASASGDLYTDIDALNSNELGLVVNPGISDILQVKFDKPLFNMGFWPSSIFKNGVSTLSIDLYNPNAGELTESTFSITLPAGVTVAPDPRKSYVCGSTSLSTNPVQATGGGSTISLSNTSIAGYASCVISVDVKGITEGDITISSQLLSTQADDSESASSKLTVGTQTCDAGNLVQNVTWQGNGPSYGTNEMVSNISQDGRYISFSSLSDRFVRNDVVWYDVFVYDRVLCRFDRVSVKKDGTQTSVTDFNLSFVSSVTVVQDGNVVVAFTSLAPNFAPFANTGYNNLYVRQMNQDPLLVSRTYTSIPAANSYAVHPVISRDGRYITFGSDSSHFVSGDTNGTGDVFLFDRQNPNDPLKRISLTAGGLEGGVDWRSENAFPSQDGRYIAFDTYADLLELGYGPNPCYEYKFEFNQHWAVPCVLVRDLGNISNPVDDRLISISKPAVDPNINGKSFNAGISPDGRYVLYVSTATNIVVPNPACPPNPAEECWYIYLHDRNKNGGSTADMDAPGNTQTILVAENLSPDPGIHTVMSDDGRYVVYTTNSNHPALGDTNGLSDVFVYDTQRKETARVSVSALGAGVQPNGPSYEGSISGDGQWIVFGSQATNLVSYDGNGYQDAFMIRNPIYGLPLPTTVSGMFSIIAGEPNPASNLPPREVYTLAEGDGTQTQLVLPSQVNADQLNGQWITVSGYEQTSATDNPTLTVTNIDSAPVAPSGLPMAQINNHNWLTLLCRFSDSTTTTPREPAWFYNLLVSDQAPSVRHYWNEQSYGLIQMGSNQVHGWFNLPGTRLSYLGTDNQLGTSEFQKLLDDCTTASVTAGAGINFSAFGGINLFFNQELDDYAWGSTEQQHIPMNALPYYVTWMPPWAYQNQSALVHEMGHSFGLHHSSGDYFSAYDSRWDVLSGIWLNCEPYDSTYGCLGVGTIAYNRDFLEWIPALRVMTVAPGTTTPPFSLEQLSQPVASDTYLIAKVPIQGSDMFYTVETRMQVGYDMRLPAKGVIIHRIDPNAFDQNAKVIDADIGTGGNTVPNGDPNDAGAIWLPGETFFDAGSNITIEVLSEQASSYTVRITNNSTATVSFNPPVLVEPQNNSQVAPSTQVLLKWNPVTGATSYEIQLTATLASTVDLRPVNGTSYSLTMPAGLGTYYWQVRAVKAAGSSVIHKSLWSDPRALIPQSLSNAVPLLNYTQASSAILTWNRVSWAVGYEVVVDKIATFTSQTPEFHVDTLGAAQLSITTSELSPGTHYWRVRAKRADGTWGGWSTVGSFILDAP